MFYDIKLLYRKLGALLTKIEDKLDDSDLTDVDFAAAYQYDDKEDSYGYSS